MALQNRVTPTGDIVAVPQRGTFTGNRGIIHDPATRTLLQRRWTTKAWIVCVCEFRGRRRDVMAMRSWTELFFLDEATALAAGHRPCYYCRRANADAFRLAWARGNGSGNARAPAIDSVLHQERLDGRAKRLHPLPIPLNGLPDGAMVQAGGESYLIAGKRPWLWTFDGYREASLPLADARLITPPSTVRALQAGYRATLHDSVASSVPQQNKTSQNKDM
ncbi:hypothetical protein [Nitrobacter sp.]|uniref:hypothetical protein n=1 Tax=Nitrobacter sp. TaxID=29420 RepID=UPI003F6518BE